MIDIIHEIIAGMESWDNYQRLFDKLCQDIEKGAAAENVLALPSAWIWDILDEYVYRIYYLFRGSD